MTMKRASTCFALALSLAAWSAPADAQQRPASPDAAEAQRLFDEAKTLVDNGKWVEACPRLAESLRLDPTMTTEFRLADCYEHTGRLASAYAHYLAAADSAGHAGELTKERFARERAEKLSAQVDRIIIVPPQQPDIRVERDGRVVPRAAWGRPEPIDPGEHTVHVAAPGKTSYATIVTVTGTGGTTRVDVPTLEDAPLWRLDANTVVAAGPVSLTSQQRSATPPPSASAPVTSATVTRDSGPQAAHLGALTPWGLGLAGVGLASLGVGVGLYAGESSGAEGCTGNRCLGSVVLIGSGTVAFLLGGALALAGISSP